MAKNYFYGIYGIELISHGEWADPEVKWHKKTFNYYDLETPLWEDYQEECKELGIEIDENDDTDFIKWVKANKEKAKEYLQNLIDCGCCE